MRVIVRCQLCLRCHWCCVCSVDWCPAHKNIFTRVTISCGFTMVAEFNV